MGHTMYIQGSYDVQSCHTMYSTDEGHTMHSTDEGHTMYSTDKGHTMYSIEEGQTVQKRDRQYRRGTDSTDEGHTMYIQLSTALLMCRVGQKHIYTMYIRYFWQKNHHI
jgi:hypothetical protein